MNYQWYPGHMTKARRMMQENIKLIDLVIELVDARIPISSRNPDIDELGKGKSRIILLNKSDLADPVWNKKWVEYFAAKGMGVLEINSRTGMGIKSIQGLVQEVCKEKIERDRKRGIVNRPRTAEDVGIIVLLDERFRQYSYRRMFPREWEQVVPVTVDTVAKKVERFWDAWLWQQR